MLWMNAFPADPADPAQNSRRLDSMRLRRTPAAFARKPGPILIKNRSIPWAEASGVVWATSGTALRLQGLRLYQHTPDQPHLADVMLRMTKKSGGLSATQYSPIPSAGWVLFFSFVDPEGWPRFQNRGQHIPTSEPELCFFPQAQNSTTKQIF